MTRNAGGRDQRPFMVAQRSMTRVFQYVPLVVPFCREVFGTPHLLPNGLSTAPLLRLIAYVPAAFRRCREAIHPRPVTRGSLYPRNAFKWGVHGVF